MGPPTNPNFSDDELKRIFNEMQEYANSAGLVVGNSETGKVQPAPFSALPHPWPKRLYSLGVELAQDYNILVHKLSVNPKLQLEMIKSTESADPDMTGKLASILRENMIPKQSIQFGAFRSDYMLTMNKFDLESLEYNNDKNDHESELDKLAMRQIEINTIASSFAGLGPKVQTWHEYAVSNLKLNSDWNKNDHIPPNPVLSEFAKAFIKAHELYVSSTTNGDYTVDFDNYNDPVILFVVSPKERNRFDMKIIEFEIYSKSRIRSIFATLEEIATDAMVDDSGILIVKGEQVAIAYLRVGYQPSDYPTLKEWDGRRILEKSMAIKCPSIGYHIVTVKKFQQCLAEKGVLEKLLPNESERIARLRSSFSGLYSLDRSSADTENVVELAIKNPNAFVLKPMREGGGGNNFYDDEMVQQLKSMNPIEREGYILQERLHPPTHVSLLQKAELKEIQVIPQSIGELGIYGLVIGQGEQIHWNKFAGHLVRTKSKETTDGGVVAGVTYLDMPILYDE